MGGREDVLHYVFLRRDERGNRVIRESIRSEEKES